MLHHLRISIFFFLLLFSTCVPLSQKEIKSNSSPPKEEILSKSSDAKHPLRGSNEIMVGEWQMPPLAFNTPAFPYLDGEDQKVSRSIGNISFGYLVSARAIQYPHPTISMLNVHAGRNLIYSSDEMVALVEGASRDLRKSFPGAITFVGNFSAVGGGDIPYSVSHNNGRDADLAFFMTDEAGNSVEPPDLLPLDDEGKHTTDSGKVYLFDTPRNWALIEALIDRGEGQLQLVFISAPLKKMLIDYAKKKKVNKAVLLDAQRILVVPKTALPHDDHFHIRIYCSKKDIESGCRNTGGRGPGFLSHSEARKIVIERARSAIQSDDSTERTMGIRRLALLGDNASSKRIESALNDSSPIVRATAARTLGSLRTGYKGLRSKLRGEDDARVSAEIIWALSTRHTRRNANAMSRFLTTPHVGELRGVDSVDLRRFAIDALVEFESKLPVANLIKLVGSEDKEIADRAHRALTFLTNVDPTKIPQKVSRKKVRTLKQVNKTTKKVRRKKRRKKRARRKRRKRSKKLRKRKLKKVGKIRLKDKKGEPYSRAEIWRQWWKLNKRKGRKDWLVSGFRAGGYNITKLNVKNVWNITRAIMGSDYTSYNAQRVLMRMTGRKVDSLSWSKADANFNWRRWVERRIRRLRAPDIPYDLTTLPKSE